MANVADAAIVRGGRAPDDPAAGPEVAVPCRRSRGAKGREIVTRGGRKDRKVSDLFVRDPGGVFACEVKSGLVRDPAGRKFLPVGGARPSGGDAIVANAELSSLSDVARARGREGTDAGLLARVRGHENNR